jgi:hypothetical protein
MIPLNVEPAPRVCHFSSLLFYFHSRLLRNQSIAQLFLAPRSGAASTRDTKGAQSICARVSPSVDAGIVEARAEATKKVQKVTSTPTEFHRYNQHNSSASSRQRIRPPRRLERRTCIQSKGDVSKEESAIYDKNATKPSDRRRKRADQGN